MSEISKPYILKGIIMDSDYECKLLEDYRCRSIKEAHKAMGELYTGYKVISAWIVKEVLFGMGRIMYFRSFVDENGNFVPFNLTK